MVRSFQTVIRTPPRIHRPCQALTRLHHDRAEKLVRHRLNHTNLLLNLPVEILLCITDHLDKDARLLLSLTCEPIYHTLTSLLDLSLGLRDSQDIFSGFIRCLRRDYPDWAISTGLMCRHGLEYDQCLHRCGDDYRDAYLCKNHELWGYALLTICTQYRTLIRKEIIDRIVRPSPGGIPTSCFNRAGRVRDGFQETVRARSTRRQLLFAFEWTREFDSVSEAQKAIKKFRRSECLHTSYDWQPRIAQFLQAISAGWGRSRMWRRLQCEYCEADFEVRMEVLYQGRLKFRQTTWRNLGHVFLLDRVERQVKHRGFHYLPKLGTESILGRNLRLTFNAGECGGTAIIPTTPKRLRAECERWNVGGW